MAGKTPELNGSFSGKRICVCSLFDCRVEQRLLNPCCLMIIGEKYGKILSTGYTGFCSIIIGGLTCYNQPLWSPVALFCVWHVCSEPARCQWLPPRWIRPGIWCTMGSLRHPREVRPRRSQTTRLWFPARPLSQGGVRLSNHVKPLLLRMIASLNLEWSQRWLMVKLN